MQIFLSALPLEEDYDEAKICHAGLCDLIDHISANPSQLVGAIGNILALVQDGEEVATHETCVRLTHILLQLQQQMPQEVRHAFQSLSGDAQQAVNGAIGQHAHLVSNVVST